MRSRVEFRTIVQDEVENAGILLFEAFAHAASARGYALPWSEQRDAIDLLHRELEADPNAVVVGAVGGAIVGVGCYRVRGDVATIGPMAVAAEGKGIGSGIVSELIERAEDVGARDMRLYADAWNPTSCALYLGCGFSVIDVAVHLERPPMPAPSMGTSRGLEVRCATPDDLEEVVRLDQKLTGQDRANDLSRLVQLVARRRGTLVGYLGAGSTGTTLGPAVAADASDLFTLVTHAFAGGALAKPLGVDRLLRARLSTAAPAAPLAALGLGFRVREVGLVMSRGAPPRARPPQLYGLEPEIL